MEPEWQSLSSLPNKLPLFIMQAFINTSKTERYLYQYMIQEDGVSKSYKIITFPCMTKSSC